MRPVIGVLSRWRETIVEPYHDWESESLSVFDSFPLEKMYRYANPQGGSCSDSKKMVVPTHLPTRE